MATQKKNLQNTAIGVILLIVGVIAGVLLVQKSQDIRNKAKGSEAKEYLVCHKSRGVRDNTREMHVDKYELEDHLNHGDILGECPEE